MKEFNSNNPFQSLSVESESESTLTEIKTEPLHYMTVLVNQRAPRTWEVVHIMEQFGRYDSSIGSKFAHASYTFNWKDNEFQIWGTKRDLNLLGKSV